MIEIKLVKIKKPDDLNFIFGQAHFIKTIEDLYEAMIESVPGIKFGIAFLEASGACKVRLEGNDQELIALARDNALEIAAGHSFIIFIKNAYPINLLNSIKAVPEVCRIFCATANPAEVLVAESQQGRGVLGVIDGSKPKGVEAQEDISWRKGLLRDLGYKLKS